MGETPLGATRPLFGIALKSSPDITLAGLLPRLRSLIGYGPLGIAWLLLANDVFCRYIAAISKRSRFKS
jgi:hypothetical protein